MITVGIDFLYPFEKRHAKAGVTEDLKNIDVMARCPEDNTGQNFIIKNGRWLYEQEDGDLYMLWDCDIPYLNDYSWSSDGTFK